MIQKQLYAPPMPKNILIDLNVIVDVLLDRKGAEASTSILELGENNNFSLYVSAHMVTTFAYILESAKVPGAKVLQHIHWLLETFIVVPVDGVLLKNALKSHIKDYEDAVAERAALVCRASAIITRNGKDFVASTIPVFSPEEYLQQY